MILLFALILFFAMGMESDPGKQDDPPTKRQLISAAGLGCSVLIALFTLIYGILASIAR